MLRSLVGGSEQAHDDGGARAGPFAAGKQPVLATQRDGPDRVLDRVIVDRVPSIIEIAHQCRPALERILDRVRGRAGAQHPGPKFVEPTLQAIDQRLGVVFETRVRVQSSRIVGYCTLTPVTGIGWSSGIRVSTGTYEKIPNG